METDYKVLYEKLQARHTDVVEDLELATAKLTANPVTIGYARESKINRQRVALNNLNRRVRVQRLQLRKLNELERGLRSEEWLALKEEHAQELEPDVWETFR